MSQENETMNISENIEEIHSDSDNDNDNDNENDNDNDSDNNTLIDSDNIEEPKIRQFMSHEDYEIQGILHTQNELLNLGEKRAMDKFIEQNKVQIYNKKREELNGFIKHYLNNEKNTQLFFEKWKDEQFNHIISLMDDILIYNDSKISEVKKDYQKLKDSFDDIQVDLDEANEENVNLEDKIELLEVQEKKKRKLIISKYMKKYKLQNFFIDIYLIILSSLFLANSLLVIDYDSTVRIADVFLLSVNTVGTLILDCYINGFTYDIFCSFMKNSGIIYVYLTFYYYIIYGIIYLIKLFQKKYVNHKIING